LLYSVLSISYIEAQTIEQLVEKNKSATCNCIKEINHIVNEDVYRRKLESALNNSCPVIETKIQTLIEDHRNSLLNYRYDLEKPYKEVEEKVIGGYSLAFGHHSPEGNPKLFLYPGNRYAIISFGDAQSGTWRVVKEKYLHLIPNKSKYPFTVYGRHNPKIKGSTKTSFLGDDFSYNTLIHYGELEEKPLLSPIFNEDANCFDFPYKETINTVYDKISLAYNPYYGYDQDIEIDIHTFNNATKFNDFIIFEHTKMNNRSKTSVITIGDGTLIFSENQITSKSSLKNISEENDLFLKKIMAEKKIPPAVYFNAGYNGFNKDEIISDQYTYNENLNTYVHIYDCTGSDCEEDDYHNPSQVNKYELLEEVTTQAKQFTIAEKSVIYMVCD